MKNKHKLRQH